VSILTVHRLKYTERQLGKCTRLLSTRNGNRIETETAAGYVSAAVTGVVCLRTPSQTIQLSPVQCRELETVLRNHRIIVVTERKTARLRARKINRPERVK
jgi:hypothetical protein